MICKPDAEAFFTAIDDLKPDIRVHLGDVFDFRKLRRRVSGKDLNSELKPDVAAGLAFLRRYRPQVLTSGNHCWRLWETLKEGDSDAQELCAIYIERIDTALSAIGCKFVPYDVEHGWWQYRGVGPRFGHGYSCGIGSLRKHALCIGHCIIAHIHGPGHVAVERLDRAEAYSSGGLPDASEMNYARRCFATLAWRHSWIYGAIEDKSGQYVAWEVRKIGNKWIYPTGFNV